MKSTVDTPVITLNQATASGKNAPNKKVLPLFDVPEPTDNDVLSGRGVTTNKHAGNVNFRSLVALNKGEFPSTTLLRGKDSMDTPHGPWPDGISRSTRVNTSDHD